jgi:ribosomal protein S27AE
MSKSKIVEVKETIKVEKGEVETGYICPICGGVIMLVTYDFKTHTWHRWTCKKCGRDYGYNTPQPLIVMR